MHRLDLHNTILALSGSAAMAAVWEWVVSLSPGSAIVSALSIGLTAWQWWLLRRREWTSERIDEADRIAEAITRREVKHREAMREQDRLDAELRRELALKPAVESLEARGP